MLLEYVQWLPLISIYCQQATHTEVQQNIYCVEHIKHHINSKMYYFNH